MKELYMFSTNMCKTKHSQNQTVMDIISMEHLNLSWSKNLGKQKLRKFMNIKTNLQETLKEILQVETRKHY
jgi:hypothetical protein